MCTRYMELSDRLDISSSGQDCSLVVQSARPPVRPRSKDDRESYRPIRPGPHKRGTRGRIVDRLLPQKRGKVEVVQSMLEA